LKCLVRRGEADITSELTLAATPQLVPVIAENLQPGLRVSKYEGQWQQLPDFAQLTAVETSVQTAAPQVAETPQSEGPEHFGLVYAGFIKIPAEGVYTFSLTSDDGSRLTIGEQRIIDSDGLHAPQTTTGLIRLQAGLYPLSVEYFEATGGQLLRIGVAGPGIPSRELPPEWLFHSR
jgi:hypothetical protein